MSKLEKTISILKDLIQFDTTSCNSNLPIMDYIKDYLKDFGIESTFIKNEEGHKANLLATIGPMDKAGIVLSGHTDVVPVELDGWITPPFELSKRDNRLYGRGTCDMKGFIAAVLASVPDFIDKPLGIPIHLCFSYDEEIGCVGVHSLIDHLETLSIKPRLAIIGEPSNMELINGHKGKIAVRCCVKGSAGHSSYAPKHVNAIEYAARGIVHIADVAKTFETNGPFDLDYTVPHSTMLTTLIKGGRATNITPDFCQFDFEIRHLPNHSSDQVLNKIKHYIDENLVPEMKAISPESGFSWQTKFSYPGMSDATKTAAYESLKKVLPKSAGKVSYGTEGGLFYSKGNIPSVICGPGSINQAHKRNEFIEIDQLTQCLDFLSKLTIGISKNNFI